jgi:fatty-acyl-CoA synthase
MQHWPLTVDKILDHARVYSATREIVTRSVEGPIVRTTYAEIHRRAKQVSAALKADGVRLGDRVATLAWNSGRHMEAWYGAMGIGAVLHTVNPRLFPEQIAWIVNHAEDRVLMFDLTFLPLVQALAPHMPTIERYVILTDAAHMPRTDLKNVVAFEDWIADRTTDTAWGGFDEQTACGLCYTSGTTGHPKGVLYSHRSNVIHALVCNQADGFGVSGNDVVLPIVPMFHANAWALAFVAPMVGCKLVMPGAKLDGASVYELIETEGVTLAAAVPTVWGMLLQHLRATGAKFSTLKKVTIGGAAVPETILRAFESEYGVEVIHAWGMTELSPVGTMGKLAPEDADADFDERVRLKLKQGRGMFTVEMKVVNESCEELPRDGKTPGHLVVRGPAVARAYFKHEGARAADGGICNADGFFDTGDVSTLDAKGYMQITDRAKDVIKSGGEWISSIDVENAAIGAPGVAQAGVIGVPHPKWTERPLLVIEPQPGAQPTKDSVLAHLEGKIAKWWMPDEVLFLDKIPLGATGKVDKKALRERFKDLRLT